jgi:hypothetical protein
LLPDQIVSNCLSFYIIFDAFSRKRDQDRGWFLIPDYRPLIIERIIVVSLLKKIFGPSKDEIWKQLSEEIGGKYIKAARWKGDSKVQVRVRDWTITLDTYTVSTGKSNVTYTRMRAPYVNKDGFRFTIYRANWFSALAKLLGMQDVIVGGPKFENLGPLFGVPGYLDKQDIESGYPEFDRDFIIKGNNESKIRELFTILKIRDLIQSQPEIFLQVKDDEGWFGKDFPEGVDELYFQVIGVIKDLDRLKSLYNLFSELLNSLCHIGSAYENDPKLEL